MKILLKSILSLLVIILIVLNVYNLFCKLILKQEIPLLFGVGISTVATDSMEEELFVGDLVFIQDTDSYQINDIIAFKKNQKILVHRIIEITELGYVTQGDNAPSDDGEILENVVIGEVVYVIRNGGGIFDFMKSTWFFVILISFVIVFVVIVPYINSKKKSKELEEK